VASVTQQPRLRVSQSQTEYRQESLANAKVSTRQHWEYESP